jgi:hypothetical protein
LKKTVWPSASNEPKIVFAIRIVGLAEIVIDRDGFNDPGDGFGPEGGHASRHDGMLFSEAGPTHGRRA